MTTPMLTEMPRRLEPITRDTFIDDLSNAVRGHAAGGNAPNGPSATALGQR
jgi:hypothetical protein